MFHRKEVIARNVALRQSESVLGNLPGQRANLRSLFQRSRKCISAGTAPVQPRSVAVLDGSLLGKLYCGVAVPLSSMD